jgi:hypothetical protein
MSKRWSLYKMLSFKTFYEILYFYQANGSDNKVPYSNHYLDNVYSEALRRFLCSSSRIRLKYLQLGHYWFTCGWFTIHCSLSFNHSTLYYLGY